MQTAKRYHDPALNVARKLMQHIIQRDLLPALDLRDREREVFRLRWEFGLSLEQIAVKLSLSRERVRTVYDTAMIKIEGRILSGLKTYVDEKSVREENKELREKLRMCETNLNRLRGRDEVELAPNDIRSKLLTEAGLSPRTKNFLLGLGLETVGDLLHYNRKSLFALPGFGIRSMQEIQSFLQKNNLP